MAVSAGANQYGAVLGGGSRPVAADVMKSLGEKCPSVIVTMRQGGAATHVFLFEHQPGMGALRNDSKSGCIPPDRRYAWGWRD